MQDASCCKGFFSLLLKESACQWWYDLCRMVMVSCRNMYPCIKVTPNQNRLECDPNHLQMLCWWTGLCRMIVQGLTKPALVGLVLAGASDWVSMWMPSCAFCSVCWPVNERNSVSIATKLEKLFFSVFFGNLQSHKQNFKEISLERAIYHVNIHNDRQGLVQYVFEESSFHLKNQIWLFMGVTARRLHGKTSGYSLSSWVLSRSSCW